MWMGLLRGSDVKPINYEETDKCFYPKHIPIDHWVKECDDHKNAITRIYLRDIIKRLDSNRYTAQMMHNIFRKLKSIIM